MVFEKKTWKDRIAEFATRRQLTKEDGSTELVTVARNEGTIAQEGDSFSAENMNGLENRIASGFISVESAGARTEERIANLEKGFVNEFNSVYKKLYDITQQVLYTQGIMAELLHNVNITLEVNLTVGLNTINLSSYVPKDYIVVSRTFIWGGTGFGAIKSWGWSNSSSLRLDSASAFKYNVVVELLCLKRDIIFFGL